MKTASASIGLLSDATFDKTSDATFDKTAVFLSLNNWLGNQCTATRLTRELNRSVLSVIRSAPSLLGMTDGTYKYFVL